MDKTVLLIILLSGLTTLTSCLTQYHYVNMQMTWSEAQSYCRETYTDLATISDTKEYYSLLNLLYHTDGYSGEVWIGLTFTNWRWSLENNETEGISNGWPAGYPWLQYGYYTYSNVLKTCVILSPYNGLWYGYDCYSSNYFVCYDGTQNATQTFVLVKEWMTWNQAQSYCRLHYTDLAIVRNPTENQAIQNLTRIVYYYSINVGNQTGNQSLVNQTQTYYYYNYYTVWIGLYRDGSWSDGSNSSFYFYSTAYEAPDIIGLNESCVTVQTSRYFYQSVVMNCNKTVPFVCYSDQCISSPNISHQYHLVNMQMTWTEAQSYCRESYTDLATVSDPEEYNSLVCQINSTLGNSSQVWIGLKFNWRWSLEDTETEGITNGWPGGFPWVQNGYIFSNRQVCVLMYTYYGQWQESYCDTYNYFVCYDGRQNATQTFVLVKEWMTWYQAQSYCRDHYTDLAIVRNQTENQAIQNLTRIVYYSYSINVGNQTGNQSLVNQTQTYYYYNYYTVWIGLYRDGSWSDGSNSSFFNANSYGVPFYLFTQDSLNITGINGSCVAVQYDLNYQYNTNNCIDTLPFVCYGAKKNTTIVQTTEPATTQPQTTEPTTTQPLTTEPVTTQPLTTEPATTQPITTEPATTQPQTTEPATTSANRGSRYVIVLRMRLSSLITLTDDFIRNVVLQKLYEELIRLGLPENFALRLWATQDINP
ncbi:macrophage mannose receptor 1 [Esox lucius]|uniref:C-type lectin domain-containing protein n=1 Tax=Esox lucius TaxID=8010 RepID=A0A3P9AC92_ESOLU|nr:macrophage mannose receptor 1 [Esox lucius]XP_019903511.3 macrophage mannose receptor 1 [Esox lucius]